MLTSLDHNTTTTKKGGVCGQGAGGAGAAGAAAAAVGAGWVLPSCVCGWVRKGRWVDGWMV